MSKFGICFFGRKGAGRRMFLDIMEIISQDESNDDFVFIGNRSITPNSLYGVTFLGIDTFRGFRSLFHFLMSYRNQRSAFESFVRNENISKILFLLPSPIDWMVTFWARNLGIRTNHIIHDAKAHPGEIWPTRASIRWRLKRSDGIICLSRYVAHECLETYSSNEIKVTSHPFFLPMRARKGINFNLPNKYVLFAGRNKKYKGLYWLLSTYEEAHLDFPLILAGSGHKVPKKLKLSNIFVINKWLDDLEMDELIAGAEVVVLPYLEGTQSGILSSAIQYKRKIVATSVGGFREQAGEYENIFWVEPGKGDELAGTLRKAHLRNRSEATFPNLEFVGIRKHAEESYRLMLKMIFNT